MQERFAEKMNWLAHLLLSPPEIEFQLGNVLADFVRGAGREAMSEAFRRGVRHHLKIDAFTDAHPVVRRSKSRIEPRFRRFAGVLVDVYYDHLLAAHWDCFCKVPLREFTLTFNQEARRHAADLPQEAAWILHRMIEEDRLWSYREISGVEAALERLSHRLNARWRRDIRLHEAVPGMVAQEAELERDFMEFFPQLAREMGAASA
jgi:acyl carrier protein phosphodiesterase